MRKKSEIKLSKEQRDEMIAAIKSYYLREKEEKIGDLAAGLLLDFIAEELAPAFYNQGVSDAQQFMAEKLDELPVILK